MSLESCVLKAKQWLDENKKIKIPVGRLNEFARILNEAGGDALTPAEISAKMTDAVENFAKRTHAKFQAQLAHDLLVSENIVKQTLENRAKWIEKSGDSSKMGIEAFRAVIEGGSLRPGEGSNLSILKMSGSLERRFLSVLENALGNNRDIAMSGAIDKDILQELHALDNQMPLMQTQNQAALDIAKAYKAVRDDIFSRKQAINPFLEAAQDFLVERNHNREKIAATDKATWVKDAMTHYGDKSFFGSTPEEKVKGFQDIYDRIVAGTYGTAEDKFSSRNYFGVKGEGGDLMRRMSKGRVLVANDWQAEHAYMSKYGDDSLYQTMQGSIKAASNDISKLTKWGSQQRETYERTFNTIRKMLPESERTEFEKFKTQSGGFDDMFDVSMGSQNSPARNRMANAAQGMMAIETMAKAGMHTLRSLPDIQNAITLTRDMFGRNLIENASEIAKEFAKGMAPFSDAQERMKDLGLMCRSLQQELMRGIGSGDTAPGFTAKGAELAGRIGLADRQQNAIKAAIGTVFSKQFAELSGTAHANLPEQTRIGLARYGIGEHEWEFIRHATQDIPYGESESRKIMTPEAIDKLSDDRAELYLRKSGQWTSGDIPDKRTLDNARFQNSLKYATLINEHADLAGANTDLRQRTFMYGNTDVNSGIGLVRRLAWQFKSASLVSNDILRRSYFSGTTSKAAFAGLAQHVVMSAFFFTLGEYINQFATGKTPEDPSNPTMVGRMLIGSGGGGVVADALINAMQGETTKDKFIELSKAAMGPGISAAAEGLAVAGQTGTEAYKSMTGQRPNYPGKQAASLLTGNIPLQNLFWTKAALNYYFSNTLKEFMGPGYLSHLERRTTATPALGGGHQQYIFGRPTSSSFFGD